MSCPALRAVVAVLLCAVAAPWAAAEVPSPLERAAQITPRANSAVLLGIAQAGPRLVAVGERGVVLLSDDAGATWRQAAVPVSTTLTAVRFVGAQQGWAVGHGGVVLHSADAGATWSRQLDGVTAAAHALKAAPAGSAAHKAAQRLVADGADKPFLDLHFFDTRRGFVVGAYGLIFGTEDGGATWVPWFERVDNPKGLHLNAVAVQGGRILLAGEQGLLLMSGDGGRQFKRLASPYDGSWFAAAAVQGVEGARWLVAGLRGKVYGLDENGAGAVPAELPIPVSVAALGVLAKGRVVALNQAGQALASGDGGRRFQPLALPPGPPLTGLLELPDGRLLASSLRGVRVLPVLP